MSEQSPLALMPETASFDEPASLPFGGQTAMHFIRQLEIKFGGHVLVYGASGAVGTMALQLLKAKGQLVTAVTSRRNLALSKSLGADFVLDYQESGFPGYDKQYDFVFDAIGLLEKKQLRQLLKPGGRSVTVGCLEVAKETKEDLEELARLFDEGSLQSVIDRVYHFDQIREAHAYLDTKRKQGSLILKLES